MTTVTANANRAEDRPDHIKKLAFAAVFAAITYVVFTFLSIRIPTPGGGQVSITLGNAFVVLGALFLGSVYGGLGGAIGLTIADLIDPVYIVEAPVTFLVKFLLGVIVGLIAHRAGHITRRTDSGGILRWVIISTVVGLLFNVFVDPSLRYVYKIVILGKPAADVSFAINFGVTAINAAVSSVVVVVLYMALRKPFKKMGLFFTF
ncbi:MAG: ECF transporter S component [Lachnospira sp.]|nr:ECF transporter S component [Lachnospira sp.]